MPEAGQVLLAGALAVVLLPVGWSSVRQGELDQPWTAGVLLALVVLHGAVAIARRWPKAAYGTGAAAMLVVAVAPDLSGPTAATAGSDYAPLLLPSSLCFFALLYAVSARSSRNAAQAALAVGLLGAVVTSGRLWTWFTGPGPEGWAWRLLLGFALVAAVVGTWSIGRFRALRAAWIAQLAERSAADERRRIAREMHDVVAHSLAVVVSHAEAGRMVTASDPRRAPEIFAAIADSGRGALTEMRGLLGVLRDDRESVAPQPGLADLGELVDLVRASGRSVDYTASRPLPPLSPTVDLTAYRVAQEALTNVTRHAGDHATASLTVEHDAEEVTIEVTDDGGKAVPSPAGRGLTGMRERVEAVGGTLQAGPTAEGWQVRAKLPLTRSSE